MAIEVVNAVREKQAYTVSTDFITIDVATEKPILLLKNTSTTLIKSLITHFLLGTDSSSVRSIFRFYANPTITTDGTALTIVNTFIMTSPPASVMTAFKLPTISANGSLLNPSLLPANSPNRGVNRSYWVDSGSNLLVTVENSVANAKSSVDINWLEGV